MNKQQAVTRLEEILDELTASVAELSRDDLNWVSGERASASAVDVVRTLALKAAHEYRERGEPTPQHVESAMVFMRGERAVASFPSDSELLRVVNTGEKPTQQNAKGKLVAKHTERLKNLIVAYLQRKSCKQPTVHVEGVLSETWISVFGHLHNLKAPEKFERWLITIGRNEVIRHLRSCIGSQVSSPPIIDGFLGTPAQILDYYCSTDAAIDVDRMLSYAEEFSEEFGFIFRLHILNGFSLAEIAHVLGKNEHAIRTQYYRGLQKLKARFEEGGPQTRVDKRTERDT